MSTNAMRRIVVACLFLAGLVALGACQTTGGREQDKEALYQPKRVALMPFRKVAPEGSDSGLARSPLTGTVFAVGRGLPGNDGLTTLDHTLLVHLEGKASFEVIHAEQAGLVFGKLDREMMGDPPSKILAEVGRKLKADAVLAGHLYRFAQREGEALAVNQPASVAIDLALVRVSDGMVIWKNSFDETQRSLSEDLFNLPQYAQHGLRWLTAEEFAAMGLDTLLKRFPWLKNEQ